MVQTVLKTLLFSFAITFVSAALGIATNLVRPGGIPLITEVPYEIFAPCKDSEADVKEASVKDLKAAQSAAVIYIDARPAKAFTTEHVKGAINVTYSALFGATEADLARVKKAVTQNKAASVIVYGVYADPSTPDQKVDFGKPLAQQLTEAGISGVKHVPGGIEKLKKSGVETVQTTGEKQ